MFDTVNWYGQPIPKVNWSSKLGQSGFKFEFNAVDKVKNCEMD